MGDVFDQVAAGQPRLKDQMPPSMASGGGDVFDQLAAQPRPTSGAGGSWSQLSMQPSDARTIPNPRIRNMQNPVDPSWGPGRSLYEGAKTGIQLGSIPGSVYATLPQLIKGTIGGTVGSAAGSKGAEMLGAGEFGQEVAGDVGGVAGGVLGANMPSLRSTVTAPVRFGARTAEAAVNSKLRPGLKLFTPADEALKTQIKIPGRDVGLSRPSPTPAAPDISAPSGEVPAQAPDTSPRNFERLVNQGTGGQALKPNVPLKEQIKATGLPQDFTPVQSSALKGYKYDPTKHEFESITKTGDHYIHGDVSPEQVDAFEQASSKGKAWGELKSNSTLVAKVVNGKRMATKPPMGMRSADPNDLTPILQESLKQAMQRKASQ